MKTLISLILLFFTSFGYSQQIPRSDTVIFDNVYENEILVAFKDKRDDAVIKEVGKLKRDEKTKTMERFGDPGYSVVSVADVKLSVEKLKNNPKVKWVSPNYKITTNAYPNDPSYTNGSLWGLNNIKANQVWPVNKGTQNVYVGVIDEGIMYWHEDLCGQIWTNQYDPVDGIDNDGNGYIDDINGWDFRNNDNTIFDGSDNHGTHVSGTIGAKGDNGLGVIGVSPNVVIISAKFLEGYGSTSDAIRAIDYITDLKIRHGLNIPAVNNSWGGGSYVQGLWDAIERAKSAGIVFVASAGNDASNSDISPAYPAAYTNDNIISVAAMTSTDGVAYFSNYGATTVDIGAPGYGIVSTLPSTTNTSTYGSYSGTSMASPHVTGAIALYKAAYPTATYSQIKNAILSNARPVTALQGKCVTGGVLDVSKFTASATSVITQPACKVPKIDTTPPTKPANFRVTAIGKNNISLAWDSSRDPESGIKYYDIEWWRPGDNVRYGNLNTNTSLTIWSLAQGTTYKIYMFAINRWNLKSPYTDTLSVTTLGTLDTVPPTTPPNFRLLGITSNSATVAWDSSTDNRGIYGYQLWLNKTGDNSMYVYGTYPQNLTYTFNNLITNQGYDVRIKSYDSSYNYSPYSPTIKFTLGGTFDTIKPSTPTNFVVAGTTNNSITLNWNAANDNVGIRNYVLYYKNLYDVTYQQTIVNGLTYTYSNLPENTSYNFYLLAVDSFGNMSLATSTITGKTKILDTIAPSAPTLLRQTSVTSNSISIAWNPSTDNVGVIGYIVSSRKSGGTFTTTNVTGLSYIHTGLDANSTYEYYVQAYDNAGNISRPSSILYANTLNNIISKCDTFVVDKPYNVVATATGASAIITWSGIADSWDVYMQVISKGNKGSGNRTPTLIGSTTARSFTYILPTKSYLDAMFGPANYFVAFIIDPTGDCSTGVPNSDPSNQLRIR